MAMFNDQLRQVLRRLSRTPVFAAITLITLGVGVGANTVIFSVLEGVLLKPLPYPRPEQLIGVWHTAPGVGIKELNMSPSNYFIDREQSTTFQDIGMYTGDSLSVTGAGEPEQVRGLDVTDGTLPILGVTPVLGRLFTREDDSPGSPETVLLTYGYWRQKFGGDSSVIGRSITLDGKPREIIGVLPRGFHFLDYDDVSLIVPFRFDRNKVKLGNFSYQGLARLKPGVTMAQASADVARLLPITNRSFPPPEGFSVNLFEKAQIAQRLVGSDGLDRHGSLDRLRKRGEPVARARRRTPPGIGHSWSSGRGLETYRRRIVIREYGSRPAGKPARIGARLWSIANACCDGAYGPSTPPRNRD